MKQYTHFRCGHCRRLSQFLHQAVRELLEGIDESGQFERSYICELCGRQSIISRTRSCWAAVDAVYPRQTCTSSGPRKLLILG